MKVLRIDSLHKAWGRGFELGPIDLTLGCGEILGVMGPNGAGKTTLLRLIWGFLRPDRGRIQVVGLEPHLEPVAVRHRAGYMPENPAFYGWMSARQHLQFVSRFYPTWNGRTADAWLRRLSIPAEQRIDTLSQGNRSKLAAVSAIAHAPAMLLLDEPTAGLDPLVRLELLELLDELGREQRTTIILSSHISDDLDRIAHRVLMIDRGRVIASGQCRDLKDRHHVQRLEEVFFNVVEATRGSGRHHHNQGLHGVS